MSIPQVACRWTTALTPSRTRASNAARSICSPRSWASNICCTSAGLGKLPVCVVRILCVLCFIVAWLLHKEVNYATSLSSIVMYLVLYAMLTFVVISEASLFLQNCQRSDVIRAYGRDVPKTKSLGNALAILTQLLHTAAPQRVQLLLLMARLC